MFIYSIYDKKGMFYISQFFARNDAEAVRQVGRAANDSRTDLCSYPDDFALYCNGEFDTNNGIITPIVPLKFVVEIRSLINEVAEGVEK